MEGTPLDLRRRAPHNPTPVKLKKPMRKRPDYPDSLTKAHFMKWTLRDLPGVMRNHSLPCALAACMLFFMFVEYTLLMIPASHPPFDIGFIATKKLNLLLANRPNLNNLLAALNTVFVAMQTGYIVWTWLIEGRPRATISALFMFTFRGILGYSTQLPLPEDFLGSGVDFPVGNVSFFLFYSGHVAASVIASLDMRRMQRWELAFVFDSLNVLQIVRLLSTRGHYTIDLIVGIGAGLLFDSIAGKYEQNKKKESPTSASTVDDAFYTAVKAQHLTRGPQSSNTNGVHAQRIQVHQTSAALLLSADISTSPR